jgi:Fe-S-cluster containining protein
MAVSLPVINLETAKFECTFGRGCEGLCCKNGRPSVTPEEFKGIKSTLKRALPLLRPEARELIEEEGFTSKRTKLGQPMLRVVDSWCVFFNKGCVLHQLGAEDGKPLAYKPVQCALFPLERDLDDGTWYVRQWKYRGEQWNDLFCLNPKATEVSAAESLTPELELAEEYERSLGKKKKRKA